MNPEYSKTPTRLAVVAILCTALSFSRTALGATADSTQVVLAETSTLAKAPVILTRPMLMLPGIAGVAHVEGKVQIRVLVGRNGKPIKTQITKREPEFAFIFDEEARTFAMNIEFSPALDSSGNAVNAWVSIPLHIQLDDIEPAVELEVGEPQYPEEALALGIEGCVGLALVVDEMGFVAKDIKPVIIAREFPEETVFDNAAIDAACRSRFTPGKGKLGNQRSWAFVKIVFHIAE